MGLEPFFLVRAGLIPLNRSAMTVRIRTCGRGLL